MKIDIYTKLVLSVIAICLCVIVARNINLIPNVYAVNNKSDEIMKVQIVSIEKSSHLRWDPVETVIAGVDRDNDNPQGYINVRIKGF
ncbi:MAG: hypothetical protein ACUZ8H_00590 [Candidatus Anammoxibacter sp.]